MKGNEITGALLVRPPSCRHRLFQQEHSPVNYKQRVFWFLLFLGTGLTFLLYFSGLGRMEYSDDSRHLLTNKDLTFQCSNGELGNRMFFYAVVYGLSLLNGRQGFVQRCNTITCYHSEKDCTRTPLDQTFRLSLPVRPDLEKDEQEAHNISFHLHFPLDYFISGSANVLTGERFPVSVTHFLHVRDEIRREFIFAEEFAFPAQQVLQQAKSSRMSATLVGVHVRRGSYLAHLHKFRRKTATPEFYQYGLEYFRWKYRDAVFVVLSDDLPWCRQHILGDDVFIPDYMRYPEVDMAILSGCQHTLFDYGTYGFWGAFLAGGEVMYFVDGIVDPTTDDVTLAKLMYPPEWIGISDDMLKCVSTREKFEIFSSLTPELKTASLIVQTL